MEANLNISGTIEEINKFLRCQEELAVAQEKLQYSSSRLASLEQVVYSFFDAIKNNHGARVSYCNKGFVLHFNGKDVIEERMHDFMVAVRDEFNKEGQ